MSTRTPGPWTAKRTATRSRHGSSMLWRVIGSNDCIVVNGVTSGGLDPVEECAEANARLIAAAPDLLEAMKRMTAEVEGRTTDDMVHRTSALDDARAAIAKATGGK